MLVSAAVPWGDCHHCLLQHRTGHHACKYQHQQQQEREKQQGGRRAAECKDFSDPFSHMCVQSSSGRSMRILFEAAAAEEESCSAHRFLRCMCAYACTPATGA